MIANTICLRLGDNTFGRLITSMVVASRHRILVPNKNMRNWMTSTERKGIVRTENKWQHMLLRCESRQDYWDFVLKYGGNMSSRFTDGGVYEIYCHEGKEPTIKYSALAKY